MQIEKEKGKGGTGTEVALCKGDEEGEQPGRPQLCCLIVLAAQEVCQLLPGILEPSTLLARRALFLTIVTLTLNPSNF